MSLFANKSTHYLGIDIGSASIKILELENAQGEPRLKNYGFAEKTHPVDSSKTENLISSSAEIIKKICKETGFDTKNAVAALHNFDVFTSVISLPQVDEKELENIITIEARKFVPIPLEDVVLDWKLMSPLPKGGKSGKKSKQNKVDLQKQKEEEAESLVQEGERAKSLDVLLTAAPRKLVKKYVDIFKVAELNLLSLETESFAFIRALLDRNDKTSQMLIDVGAVATDIIIVERQVPVIIRTVDVGGISITNAIQRNLRIDVERAEQFKRDVGIYSQDAKEDNQVIMQLMESSFAPVVNEIRYSLDLYKSRSQNIEKIILSGGSAHLLGLVDFLKKKFHLPVYIGDPWHKISYPEALKQTLSEIGPMFTVSIGLALKEIEE